MIIEDPPPPQAHKGRDPRPYHIVVCSAQTSKSLLGNQRRLYDFIKAHPEMKLSDLSYTTTARRLHHVKRRSYYTSSVDDLVQQLGADLSKSPALLVESPKTEPVVVFTFTGQGSIYPGMGKQLVESCSRFRNNLVSYQKICDSYGLPEVLDIFTEPDTDLALKSTVQIQLAITFLEIAMADLLMSWGIRPSLLIGHSLGEYAAMCVSGVLSVTDTLYLVGKRSSLLQERCESGAYAMLAVGASVEQLEPTLSTARFKSCQVACINSPTKTVVSGPINNLRAFRDQIQSGRIRTTFLEIPYGFHSSQVDPILHDFESSAKALNFAHPAIPVASTLMAGTIVEEKGIFSPAYLARQAREPVNFAGTLQACAKTGLIDANTIWFEVGPEPVNLNLVRNTLNPAPKSLLPILKSSEDNWKTVTHALSAAYTSAITVDWTEYHKEYSNALRLLELPSYAFDLKDYWASYSKNSMSDTPLDVRAKPTPDSFVPSTTLQHLQQSTQSEDGITATFSSALSEPMLLATIKGHLVDGTALCPASVFCDMAFAAAKYLFARSNLEINLHTMVLEDLEITHPLIASGKDILQLTVKVNASWDHGSKSVKVSFNSCESGSSSVHDHGSCAVHLGEATKLRTNHHDSLKEAKGKLDSLVVSAKTGQQIRLPKSIVYHLLANVVKYEAAYQSMEEVYLDNSHKDAAASVRLTTNQNAGTFTHNPYWTDAIVHLAGFVLNGDVTKPDNIAYIATGFKELFILEALRQNTEYLIFSSIQAEDKRGVSSGHVYVFQEQRLVAVCAGISFQRMTKDTLRIIMGKSQIPAKSDVNKLPADIKEPGSTAGSPVGLTSTAVTSVSNGSASQIVETVLATVASETGYSVEDMNPSVSFADIGVDSLLSIAIVSAIKRTTGVELPGSFFQNHPTVADVINEFTADEISGSVSAPPVTSVSNGSLSQIVETVLAAVASETGYSIDDMDPSVSFADIGVDSLMSIAIVSAVKRMIGVELPGSFFQVHPTVADVMNEFTADETSGSMSAPPSPPFSTSENDDIAQTPPTPALLEGLGSDSEAKSDETLADPVNIEPFIEKSIHAPVDLSAFTSRSVLVHGRAMSKATPLFLIADGAGSAAAYIHLPPLLSGGKIYALESPFLADPSKYTCSVEEVAGLYLIALRETQPEGPYIVGGWSAGAVYAYEVARQLLNQGETVLGLILIDMRVPKPMPDGIEPTLELVEEAGLVLGLTRAGQAASTVSKVTKQHLLQTTKALMVYKPAPMDPSNRPGHTCLIWAKQGLKEREGFGKAQEPEMTEEDSPYFGNVMEDPDTGLRSWFYAKRTNFGPNGWDKLVGDVDIHTMDGDHFSIVVPPRVSDLGCPCRSVDVLTISRSRC